MSPFLSSEYIKDIEIYTKMIKNQEEGSSVKKRATILRDFLIKEYTNKLDKENELWKNMNFFQRLIFLISGKA